MRGPSSWASNATDSFHDSPGADDVLCPGKPDAEYCDCDADCSSSVKFCECGEAKAIACCGTSRAERKANATATKSRKQAAPEKKIFDNKVVAAHNKSKAHEARDLKESQQAHEAKDLKQSQHHDESVKDSKWTDTGANSNPGGVAPNPGSAAPKTMAPNTMAPNTMAPNTMAPNTMSPGADEATSLARQRKRGGGRSMALLPLLWSHGGDAGLDPDETQKGQPNTRW